MPKKYTYQQKSIQRSATTLIQSQLEKIEDAYDDIHIVTRSKETQDDLGIDMEFEIVDRHTHEKHLVFFVQVKGTSTGLKSLKQGNWIGYISFQIKCRNISYYRNDLNVPTIILVVDLKNQVIYWHAIQLDQDADNSLEKAIASGSESIQIYIDPLNRWDSDNMPRFYNDIQASQQMQVVKTRNKTAPFGSAEEIQPQHLGLLYVFEKLQSYFADLTYIHPDELVQKVPFRLTVSAINTYHCFTATIENKQLFSFLSTIHDTEKITDETIIGIPGYEEKITYIWEKLSSIGIAYIKERKTQEHLRVPFFISTCNCYRCQYHQKFNYLELLRSPTPKDLGSQFEEGLRLAYVLAQLGNLTRALLLYMELAPIANRKKRYITLFHINYNIYLLRSLLFLPSKSNTFPGMQKKIPTINLQDEYEKIKELVKPWSQYIFKLSTGKLLADYVFEIQKLTQKIKEHYLMQLKGGWSNNEFYCSLRSRLVSVLNLLQQNGLLFNLFSEFSQIMASFGEGILYEYAIQEEQKPLHSFDEFIITILFLHGDSDSLLNTAKELKIQNIKSDEVGIQALSKMVNKVFNEYRLIQENLSLLEDDNHHLISHLRKMLNNAMVLFTLLEVPKEQVTAFADQVTRLELEHQLFLHEVVGYFQQFIFSKNDDIDATVFQFILDNFVQFGGLHEEGLIYTFFNILHYKFPAIQLTDALGTEIAKLFLKNCPTCGRKHALDNVTNLLQVADASFRHNLITEIEDRLNKEFDASLYYSYAMDKEISFNQHLGKFIAHVSNRLNAPSFRQAMSGQKDIFNHGIDELINLALKYGLDLSDKKFDPFRNYSEYYKWLFNLFSYDYSNFNLIWLHHHATHYYKEYFSKSEQIKKMLETYLTTQADRNLSNLYFTYFIPGVTGNSK